MIRLEVYWRLLFFSYLRSAEVSAGKVGCGSSRFLCNGQDRDNARIYVPGHVKSIPVVSLLLSLEVCQGSLLHRFKVCCNIV